MAKTLVYTNLVTRGHGVRISDEDSGCDTFSHCHVVLHDQKCGKWNDDTYAPLRNMGEGTGELLVTNPILNEGAVMTCEYGLACSAPDKLTIQETQLGGFANGAQVTTDQFLSSGETRRGRPRGLIAILSHGYDGQGPECSSGRIERWLQLRSEHNMQVIIPSEASQMSHLLQCQVSGSYRKPLVIFMSKRLLRFKGAVNPLENFTEGSRFRPVVGDTAERDNNEGVKRVTLCTGQAYYDLEVDRIERKLRNDAAIVHAEQLYPFPYDEVCAELAKYPNAKSVVQAQEEPKNQGAFYRIRHRLEDVIGESQKLSYVGRSSSVSLAVGYMSKRVAQLK